MSQSLSKIYVHIVFSTKNRAPLLSDSIRPKLFPYTGAVLKNLDCIPIEIGGASDHVHILVIQSKNLSAAKLIEEVKKPTSKWLKTQDPSLIDFRWQAGFGIFSVGESEIPAVRRYIQNQEDHHKTVNFQDELRQLFREHGIDFDERYVWD